MVLNQFQLILFLDIQKNPLNNILDILYRIGEIMPAKPDTRAPFHQGPEAKDKLAPGGFIFSNALID